MGSSCGFWRRRRREGIELTTVGIVESGGRGEGENALALVGLGGKRAKGKNWTQVSYRYSNVSSYPRGVGAL